jgi:hypothetical protein
MENEDLRTWEGGDETTPPSEREIKMRTAAGTVPTPETEAEEI